MIYKQVASGWRAAIEQPPLGDKPGSKSPVAPAPNAQLSDALPAPKCGTHSSNPVPPLESFKKNPESAPSLCQTNPFLKTCFHEFG